MTKYNINGLDCELLCTAQFNYSEKSKAFAQDASALEMAPGYVPEIRLLLVSAKTGEKRLFYRQSVIMQNGDIGSWVYADSSVDSETGFYSPLKVYIHND
jgi:hypothetical protein